MRAWGTGSFENDEAMAWVSGRSDTDLEPVRAVLAPVAEPDGGDVDASAGARALVAAEVVATLRGAPSSDLPAPVGAWIDTLPRDLPDDLIAMARAATDRVVTVPSALLERWDAASDDGITWRAGVADLRGRLGSS